MIYTVDRVQFDQNKDLIVFEFVHRFKDDKNFVNKKITSLMKIPNINMLIVYYDDDYKNGSNISICENGSTSVYNWENYKNWFLKKNAVSTSTKHSKPLGSATHNEGDPYIQELLKKIHKIDFSLDDNGLGLTKNALSKQSTYGFDFDLFDNINNTIIEFLNNETPKKGNNPLKNTQAHPMRYSWISDREQEAFAKKMNEKYPNWSMPHKSDNRQKYISLWKAKQKLNGELYLVNYNKLDKNEDLSIIEVIDLDETKGILSDISYKATYEQMVIWLKIMNEFPLVAKQYLIQLPKEIRDYNFWNEYYQNQATYQIPTRSHIGKEYK